MPSMFPKPAKRAKKAQKLLQRKTPLKRTTKPIANRAVFREWGKNCTKTYRRRFTDAEVLAKAHEYRAQRLANATPAEEALDAILRSLGIKFFREWVVLNGDRFVLLDFWLPTVNLCIHPL